MRRWSFLAAALLVAACGGDDEGADEPTGPKIVVPTFAATGQPLSAPDKTWTWIEVAGTQCRDGSTSALAVNLNPASKNVMIYLEGGGACYDQLTCAISPGNVAAFKGAPFSTWRESGLFARGNPKNPVGDWNFIYVPYCTGDTHAGANPNAVLPGVEGTHQFVGYLNMKKYLDRIVPTFPQAENVLLTGISAGGFGAGQNALLVQGAFPAVKLKLLDDSGPALSPTALPECLQAKWKQAWALDQSYLKDCGAPCADFGDNFVQPLALAMARTFDDRPAGLIESTQDGIITGFFGAGNNNCMALPLLNKVPGDVFAADLAGFRKLLKPYPNFGTWTPAGDRHTWINNDDVYTVSIGNKLLIDWITDIVNGKQPGSYGP